MTAKKINRYRMKSKSLVEALQIPAKSEKTIDDNPSVNHINNSLGGQTKMKTQNKINNKTTKTAYLTQQTLTNRSDFILTMARGAGK